MLQEEKEDIIRQITGDEPVSEERLAGIRDTLDWVERNTICLPRSSRLPDYHSRVLEAIDRTITDTFGMKLNEVYSASRKQPLVLMRARAMTTFQQFTGSTETQTVEAFGNVRTRITYHHLKNLVENMNNLYPQERIKSEAFKVSVINYLSV